MTYEERLVLARQMNERFKAGLKLNQVNVENMILDEELTEDDLTILLKVYDEYKIGVRYSKGDKFHHQGMLYEVTQPERPAYHTSQEDWSPATTPSLYSRITPGNIIKDWEQRYNPNEYVPGDVVRWTDGKIYECIIKTTYSPTDYPQAWKVKP